MATAAKRKSAEPVELEPGGKPVVAKNYDEITYVPGPQDPPFTRWNGVDFQANKPVRVSKDKTVLAPIRKENVLADGSIVSRGIEQRISMGELAKGSPVFRVNGVDPAPRKKIYSRMPADAHAYKSYSIEWIAKCETEVELVSRWDGEEALREKLGVEIAELQNIMPFLEARRDALKGLHGALPMMD